MAVFEKAIQYIEIYEFICGAATPQVDSFFIHIMKYSIKNDFIGKLLFTDKSYVSKPSNDDISHMIWNNMSVTTDMLSMMIENGYSFCPTSRKLENVKESSFICIDIDNSTIEMNEFVTSLKDTPTIYYTTPNNGSIEKSIEKCGDDRHLYRFRLIYALNTPTSNAQEYIKAYNYIVDTNEMNKFGDVVDLRVANQYYNGSYRCEIHNTNYIYTLPDEYKEYEPKKKKEINNKKSAKHYHNNNYTTITLVPCTFSDDVYRKFMSCKKYNEFLEWYRGEYGDLVKPCHSLYTECEDERILTVKGDYYELPRKRYGWDKVLKQNTYCKWVDGEDRHTKIYIAGIVIRHLKEDVSYDEMLYFIVDELTTYYDICDYDSNGKKTLKFDKMTVIKLIDSIFKADINKELKEVKHSKYRVNDDYCNKNRIAKKEVIGMINSERERKKKEDKYSDIDFFFEPEMTIEGKKISQRRWVEILNENGVEISLRSFKEYLKERGYSKTNKKSAKHYHNNIYITITLVPCTFSEENYRNDEQRRFREICDRINYGDCDFSKEIEWFNTIK